MRKESRNSNASGSSIRRYLGIGFTLFIGFVLSGCTTPLSVDSRRSALSEVLLEREVSRQVDKDPFPSSQEAGIR